MLSHSVMSVHQAPLFMKLFQARIVEWVAISYLKGLPNPGTEPACLVAPALAGRFFTTSLPGKPVEAVYFFQWRICSKELF